MLGMPLGMPLLTTRRCPTAIHTVGNAALLRRHEIHLRSSMRCARAPDSLSHLLHVSPVAGPVVLITPPGGVLRPKAVSPLGLDLGILMLGSLLSGLAAEQHCGLQVGNEETCADATVTETGPVQQPPASLSLE